MKKYLLFTIVAMLLTGCGSKQTLETVTDDYVQPVMAQMQQIAVSLPMDATVSVLEETSAGTIYLCDGYTVTVQTTEAGDLRRTLQETTGYSLDELRTIQTQYGDLTRTEGVWTAAGEQEEQLGRFAVLDDGNYHYVLTCMADVTRVEELQSTWQDLFDSFRLVSPGTELNTGS